MSLISDYVVAITLSSVILVAQLFLISAAGPETVLYEMTVSAEHLNAQQRADFYYKAVVLWGGTIGHVVNAAWPILRAYRRQAATARARPP